MAKRGCLILCYEITGALLKQRPKRVAEQFIRSRKKTESSTHTRIKPTRSSIPIINKTYVTTLTHYCCMSQTTVTIFGHHQHQKQELGVLNYTNKDEGRKARN